MRKTLLAVAAVGCLGLSACSGSGQNPAMNSLTGPASLDSGITASNGGGQRALGNAQGINIGSGGSTEGTAPNQKGNAY